MIGLSDLASVDKRLSTFETRSRLLSAIVSLVLCERLGGGWRGDAMREWLCDGACVCEVGVCVCVCVYARVYECECVCPK